MSVAWLSRAVPLSVLAWFGTSVVYAASPTTAAGYPSRLSLAFVMQRAESAAAAFQALQGDRLAIEVPEMRARAAYSPRLSLGVRRLDDQNRPNTPFSPVQNLNTTYFAGYEQGIPWSGTRLSAELLHSSVAIDFPGTDNDIPPYFETRLGFNVTQSLWNSLWKGADRLRNASGEAGREANRLQFAIDYDRAALTTIELYYRAWLAQSEVRAAQTALKNRTELRDVTRLKQRRGTAERPDLLQSEASVEVSQTELTESVRQLGDIWRLLIVTLALPPELMTINPMDVPVDLDHPFGWAKSRCEAYAKDVSGTASGPTLIAQVAEARSREATLGANSLQAASGVDFLLKGSYLVNGVDTSSRVETVQQVGGLDFPAWSVELSARFPLGMSIEAVDARAALAQSVRADAIAAQERSQQQVDRMNRCFEYQERERSYAGAVKIHEAQAERLRLEQDRFRIGRSTLTQMVIAADDLVFADRRLQAAEVQRRLAAWRVVGLEGGILEKSKEESRP